MSLAKRVIMFGIAGLVIGTPLDALHVKTGVLLYKYPSLGLQAWWVPVLFALAGIALCESHHQISHLMKQKRMPVNYKLMISSLLLLVIVYGSSGFLKNLPYLAVAIFLVLYLAGVKMLWKESGKMLFVFTIGVAIAGPLIEAMISLTGQFHYLHPDLLRVPVWLPFIYINSVFIAEHFDNFVSHKS